MIGPEHETPRPAEGAGFGDAVTFAFGDPATGLYGSARLGLVPGEPAHAGHARMKAAASRYIKTGFGMQILPPADHCNCGGPPRARIASTSKTRKVSAQE